MTYFELLEIKPTNDEQKIKKAYLKQIKKFHPDTYTGEKIFAEKKSMEINLAYQVLKNKRLRQDYILKNNLKILDAGMPQENITKEKSIKKNLIKQFFIKRYGGENKGKFIIDVCLWLLMIFLLFIIFN